MYILHPEGVLITLRKKYSAEFKRKAVFQIQHPSVSFNHMARDLVINPNLLSRCKRELNASRSHAAAGFGIPRDEELAQRASNKLNQFMRPQ